MSTNSRNSLEKENEKEKEKEKEKSQDTGSIGTFDFYIWTFIPAIGILCCLLHINQEHLWEWKGDTIQEAQSFRAKVVVSVMSTVIGGCVAATFAKAISGASYTFVRYRRANFSQLVTMIGGFSPSHIPMLTAVSGWISILLIILLISISSITKQLPAVSMGVSAVSKEANLTFSTRSYSKCAPNYTANVSSRFYPMIVFDILNSIRNQNTSFTNEYYDRGIPADLKGRATFKRKLPFSNVTCKSVPQNYYYSSLLPTISPLLSGQKSNKSTFSNVMTIALQGTNLDKKPEKWVNCTITVGHATAVTSCNNTLCKTNRESKITTYTNSQTIMSDFLSKTFDMTLPSGSDVKSGLFSWLLGGDSTRVYQSDEDIPGKSVEMIQKRTEILATIAIRILCDHNTGKPANEMISFDSQYKNPEYYVYGILWKWPFYLVIGFLSLSWLVSIATMWITPECRVISIEWILSQYISEDRPSYSSGIQLIKYYKGSFFKIIDKNPKNDVGKIAISEMCYTTEDEETNDNKIIQKREYQ